jgi:hypothetical protein
MGWETRRNGTYYYRARKVGGRVLKEYVGAGPLAEVAAAADVRARNECIWIAEQQRAERTSPAAIDGLLGSFIDATEALTRATLVLAGFHCHHGGEWRRRRNG